MSDDSLMERIDLYCAGRLSESQVEELWSDLLNYPEYFGYLQTAANLAGIELPPLNKSDG